MSFWRIIYNSIRQHIGSSLLAAISICLGVALLIAVFSLREQTHKTFTEIGTGIDAVLGGAPVSGVNRVRPVAVVVLCPTDRAAGV